MTAPHDDHDDPPCCPSGTCSAVGTAALADVLRRYLEHIERAQRSPDLSLLRTAASVLQARLGCRGKRCQTVQRLREWLEWEAPLFEPSPRAAPAARGDASDSN